MQRRCRIPELNVLNWLAPGSCILLLSWNPSPVQSQYWQTTGGLTHPEVRALAVTSDNTVLAGTALGGIYRSTDSGDTWEQSNSGIAGDRPTIRSLAINSVGAIFAGTEGSGIYRSVDRGDSWEQLNSGLPANTVTSLVVSSHDMVYAGTSGFGGIYRSIDGGDTWQVVSSGLAGRTVQSIAIHPNGSVFAGTFVNGLYRVSPENPLWEKLVNGLPNPEIAALVVNDNGDILAGTIGDGTFRSTDNGDRWTATSMGLTDVNVSALLSRTGQLFAGTFSGGVFLSIDGGDSWAARNDGLTDRGILALAFNEPGFLFAGTFASGVFRSTQAVVSVATHESSPPGDFILLPNYPNPFNPGTQIEFRTTRTAHFNMAIYNIRGQRMRTLANALFPAGQYRLSWDGRDHADRLVASGVYLLRLESGKFSQTRKLLLSH